MKERNNQLILAQVMGYVDFTLDVGKSITTLDIAKRPKVKRFV